MLALTFGMVIGVKEQTILSLICFRGTLSIADVITDLVKCLLVSLTLLHALCHCSFCFSYSSLINEKNYFL